MASSAGSTAIPDAAATGPTWDVPAFTKVRLSTSIEANIEIGAGGPVEPTDDPDAVATVLTVVSGNTLDIHVPSGTTFDMKERLRVHVPTPSLKLVEATTSAPANVKRLACDRIEARVTTSAKIALHGRREELDVTARAPRTSTRAISRSNGPM